MSREFVAALVEWFFALPPVRYVMGLEDSQRRLIWAALGFAVILYLLARTMSQLSVRRARLRLIEEIRDAIPPRAVDVPPIEPANRPPSDAVVLPESFGALSDLPIPTAVARERAVDTPSLLAPREALSLGVVAGGLVVAAVALAGIALVTRAPPNEPPPAASLAAMTDSATPIDIRWRSGRLDNRDCVATFEVTRGTGSRARLVAFVMDTTGAIIARDSVQVTSAVSGLFVDFRFRKVGCDRIHDWQLQATTPMSKPQ